MRERSTCRELAVALVLVAAPAATAQKPGEVFVDRIAQLIDVVETRHVAPPPARTLVASGIDQLEEQLKIDLAQLKAEVPQLEQDEDVRRFLARVHAAVRDHGEPRTLAVIPKNVFTGSLGYTGTSPIQMRATVRPGCRRNHPRQIYMRRCCT